MYKASLLGGSSGAIHFSVRLSLIGEQLVFKYPYSVIGAPRSNIKHQAMQACIDDRSGGNDLDIVIFFSTRQIAILQLLVSTLGRWSQLSLLNAIRRDFSLNGFSSRLYVIWLVTRTDTTMTMQAPNVSIVVSSRI